MKVLSTEAQSDLLGFLEDISKLDLDQSTKNQMNYWLTEIKPKRVRKKLTTAPAVV